MTTKAKEAMHEKKRGILPLLLLVFVFVFALTLFVLPLNSAYANEEEESTISTEQPSLSRSPTEQSIASGAVAIGSVNNGTLAEAETEAAEEQEEQSPQGELGDQAGEFSEEDVIGAQTNQGGSTIADAEIPLAESITTIQSSNTQGSIFNTVLVAITTLTMLVMILALSIRKVKDYRIVATRTIAAAVGLVVIASWSLLDKLQAMTQLFNESTPLITVLFCAYAVAFASSYAYEVHLGKKKLEGSTEE